MSHLAYPAILANAHWNLAAFLALFLSGLFALLLGVAIGSFLWRRHERRVRLIESENERLAREAASLERHCRELETGANLEAGVK